MRKICFEPVSNVPEGVLDRHRAYSHSLGLPEIVSGKAGAAAPDLAVVGGSPDVDQYVDRLREWDGEVWAINQTHEWCRDNRIPYVFYRIDALPPDWSLDGFERAILADTVAPEIFDALLKRGVAVELVRLSLGNIHPATTAAGTAPMIAPWRGHRHITFFGCGSSYTDRTHAYRNEAASLIWVECGGEEYVTSAPMIMQAEWLAEVARAFPEFITVEGDGFLPALVKHGDYDVTHINRDLHERLSA